MSACRKGFPRWLLPLGCSLGVHVPLVLLLMGGRMPTPQTAMLRPGFDIVTDGRDAELELDVDLRLVPRPRPTQPPAPKHPLTVLPTAMARTTTSGSATLIATAPRTGTQSSTGTARPIASRLHVPGDAQRVVYVIDRSFSMGLHGGLVTACRELLASVNELPADHVFQVVAYNRFPVLLAGNSGLVPASSANKTELAQALAALSSEGQTDHASALKAALRLSPDVIIWLTDADDFRSDEVRDVIRYDRNHIPICVFVLRRTSRPVDLPALHLLAQGTGGSYRTLSATPEP